MSNAAPAPSVPASTEDGSTRVAIVGRIDDLASEVSGFIEHLGIEPVVVGSLPGASVAIEKLEELRGVAYAVLLPADSAVAHASLMAMGFLLAAAGRNRICFLSTATQPALPSWSSATGVKVDETGLWRLLLAREMKRAGVGVDLNLAI